MERLENNESNPLKEKVIKALKEKGPSDPEAIKLLTEWTIKKEQETEEKVRNGKPEAEIEFEIERAELYLAAQLFNESFEAFLDAQIKAENQFPEYLRKITLKINNMIRIKSVLKKSSNN